jgi:radical SAM protein with 4Fe4S-binding SPASM domain
LVDFLKKVDSEINSDRCDSTTFNDKLKFLTSKLFDYNLLSKYLKENIISLSNNDKKIVEHIILDIQSKNFSLFTPQVIHFLDHSSNNKWIEYLIFRYKFENFPKNKIISEFPNYVLIEPVSSCNLRCVMCFQIDKSFSSNKNLMGHMTIDLFKKIIDEVYAGGTKAITIASRGEPTLHPKLGEMLEYCKGKFFELKVNSNATLLNDKLIHQILQSDITDMVFSVDSYEKSEYEKIRVKGIFETVLNNIKKFKEIREEHYPKSRCATRISGVKINKEQDIDKFKNFWKEYVDHVVMVEMENRWDTYHNPKEIAGKGACNYLWERMYVWYDGICNPCDVDYKSELTVGSIKNNTIYEIWNSKKYNELRSMHLNHKRNSVFPCDRCPVGS